MQDNMDRYDVVNRSLEMICANPIPVALLGIGAAWLIAANAVPDERIAAARRRIAGVAGDLGNRAGELALEVGGRIGMGGSADDDAFGRTGNPMIDETARHGNGWVHQVADTAQGALRSARNSSAAMFNRVAGDSPGQVAGELTDAFERNPLIVGAIGVAAGALLAGLLPITRSEERLLRRSELPQKARAVGEKAVAEICDTAARALGAAVAAVKAEAAKP